MPARHGPGPAGSPPSGSRRDRRLPLRRLVAGARRVAGRPQDGQQVAAARADRRLRTRPRSSGAGDRAGARPGGGRAQRDEADELRIVAAGARADLGQLEQALTVLSTPQLDPARTGTTAARLFYAYADTLLALDRGDEAVQWFLHSAAADVEGVTDAEDRVSELG